MANAVPNPAEILPPTAKEWRPLALGHYFPLTYRLAHGIRGEFRVWPGTVEDRCPPFVRTPIESVLSPFLTRDNIRCRLMATLEDGFKSRWRRERPAA